MHPLKTKEEEKEENLLLEARGLVCKNDGDATRQDVIRGERRVLSESTIGSDRFPMLSVRSDLVETVGGKVVDRWCLGRAN